MCCREPVFAGDFWRTYEIVIKDIEEMVRPFSYRWARYHYGSGKRIDSDLRCVILNLPCTCGTLRTVGATNCEEYLKHIEKMQPLSRRLLKWWLRSRAWLSIVWLSTRTQSNLWEARNLTHVQIADDAVETAAAKCASKSWRRHCQTQRLT